MPNQSCCSGSSAAKKKSAGCCGGGTSTATPHQLQPVVKNQNCCSDTKPAETGSSQKASGCGGAVQPCEWISGSVQTPVGEVPRVGTTLSSADVLDAWKCRWGIGRMDYAIDPGLYCVGNPDAQALVLVTSNYKMTFDRLRKELSGLDAWIVVLDTDGINVWCAAGKGTFSTEELVNRLQATRLLEIVSHRTIILPQLGASGVAAHLVAKQSGFRVVYGPVRACDIKGFLKAGMQATDEMRTVRFTFRDRLVLTPVELIAALKKVIIVFGVMFILTATGLGQYGLIDLYAFLGAVFVGTVFAPALLPWIPGRAFSLKGFFPGFLLAVGIILINGFLPASAYNWLRAAAYLLLLPALSAFWTINFTGSSTYTSLSGVDKEMRIALPIMIISTGIGAILMLVNDLIHGFG